MSMQKLLETTNSTRNDKYQYDTKKSLRTSTTQSKNPVQSKQPCLQLRTVTFLIINVTNFCLDVQHLTARTTFYLVENLCIIATISRFKSTSEVRTLHTVMVNNLRWFKTPAYAGTRPKYPAIA